ncbi:MAG: hypothetical protein M3P23_13745 [Actinomycetota bacterium]|nr:hypothetical protein [Actinomycetota bacterium]
MSTTETPRVDGPVAPQAAPKSAAAHDVAAGADSIWGASPPATGSGSGSSTSVSRTETVRGAGPRRFPELVKTKVAALLAMAGLAVGGVAGVAIGHSTASGGQQAPAGFPGQTGQNGQTGQRGQGGPGGLGPGGPGTQQGQSGTQPDGSAAQGSTGTTT